MLINEKIRQFQYEDKLDTRIYDINQHLTKDLKFHTSVNFLILFFKFIFFAKSNI